MVTKRRASASDAGSARSKLSARLERSKGRLELLQRQAGLRLWVETIDEHLAPIFGEMRGIGKLARDQDRTRTRLADLEAERPAFGSAARAVFAILHHADRQAPLLAELDEATRRRDEERKAFEDATHQYQRERAIFDANANRRPSWRGRRRKVNPDAQWSLVVRRGKDVKARKARVEEAESVRRPLAEESERIEGELAAFRLEHGASPAEIYARVDAHRQDLTAQRQIARRLNEEISDRRAELERVLHRRLEQLRELGLVTTIPDGAEMMVAAIQQSFDMAVLELQSSDLDHAELQARKLMSLARRLRLLDQ